MAPDQNLAEQAALRGVPFVAWRGERAMNSTRQRHTGREASKVAGLKVQPFVHTFAFSFSLSLSLSLGLSLSLSLSLSLALGAQRCLLLTQMSY